MAAALVVVHDPDPALWSAQEITHYRNYVADIEQTVLMLAAMTITDRATAKKLSDGIAECKKMHDHIESIRRGQVDPLNDQVKSYNDTWRPLTDVLTAWGKEGKRQLLAYQQQEREAEARRAEAARKAQEAAAKAEAEALAKLEAAKTKKQREKAEAQVQAASGQMLEARLAEPMPMVEGFRSDHGSNTSRWPWRFTVHDPSLVPRQFLMVDEKAIRAAVCHEGGVRDIPGVHIYQEETLATRS